MAITDKTAVSVAVPTLWSKKLLAQAENRTFWHRFEGPDGSGMPLTRIDDLTREAGDTIKSDLVMALTGAGITSETSALLGNEEALGLRQLSFTVAPLRHGVAWTELAQNVNIHNLRTVALGQLTKWLAGKLDDRIWTELTGGGTTMPTPNLWYAGAATSTASLTASTTLTLNDISDLKAYAKSTLKIEPLRVSNGDEYYGLVVHPFSNLDLKKNSTYQTAQQTAGVRGLENPIFTGAEAIWDGVILYESNRVPVLANGGSGANVTYAKNIFFGANAVMRGFAMYPDWREEFTDYGNKAGIATSMILGQKLNVYDLSAAGDASGNQALGSLVYNTAYNTPVA